MNYLYLISVCFFFSCNSSPQNEPITLNGEAFGTYYSMTYFDETNTDLSQAIDSTIRAINKSMSTYDTDSDISKINKGDTVKVGEMFIENFMRSKEIFDTTAGYFDPTVGILVNYYGFGPVKMGIDVSKASTDSLMQYVGFDKVKLNSSGVIVKNHPAIFLDFNSIAKGYGVDRLGLLLERKGIDNFIIDIGGEILAKGSNLKRENAWRVGIDRPSESNTDRTYDYVLELYNEAIATSGNYRKFSQDDSGVKYVHTINPKTGESIKTDVLSASVVAPDCMTADAYATAFMAMGYIKTVDFLKQNPHLKVVLIFSDNDGEISTFISENLEGSIEEI